MAPDLEQSEFSLGWKRLTVHCELGPEHEEAFGGAIEQLVAGGHDEVVIDLSRVKRISSRCVGRIAREMVKSKKSGTKVAVLAGRALAGVLELAGLAFLGELRVLKK